MARNGKHGSPWEATASFFLLIAGLYRGKLLTQLLIRYSEEPYHDLEEITDAIASGDLVLVVSTVNKFAVRKDKRPSEPRGQVRFRLLISIWLP